MLQTNNTSWKPAQMVWASIWLDKCSHPRRRQLVIMEQDLNAPRGGYSAQSYIKALEKGLLPYWHCFQLFTQDNAHIHTATVTCKFSHDQYINTINWPAYLLDLNPSEHLW
jgi:hypothetical protein